MVDSVNHLHPHQVYKGTHHSNLLSRLDVEREVLEHGREMRRVLDDKVLNDELAIAGRPSRWRALVLNDRGCLLRNLEVLDDTLD